MKLLLINPPMGGIYYKLGFLFPPLGLAYLAAAARTIGVEVRIVDLAVDPKGLDILEHQSFDLVGISGDTSRHQTVMKIVQELEKYHCRIVLGGPHATYRDREILNSGADVAFIVRREGERTLQELLTHLDSPAEFEGIKGLTFRNERGNIVINEDRPFIGDLDTLPLPARDLLPMDKYRTLELRKRKITPLVTSRGCPFQCPFCCSSEFAGTRWRTHSLERIMEEIEIVTNEYNFRAIAFIDDTFTIDIKRLEGLCERMAEKDDDLRWWCFSRPDIVLKNPHIVEKMALSGARYVFMGMESGDQTILDRFKKGVHTHRGIEAVELLNRYGIETMASYMFCYPEETKETAEKTITFARGLPTGAAQFSILTPFPGTRIHEELSPELLHENWDEYDCTHLVFNHPNLTPEEAKKIHSRAYRRYYLTLRRILVGLLSSVRGKGVKLKNILPVLKKQT